MSFDFKRVPYEQNDMYSFLPGYSNMGKSPIWFSSSNTSADYTSNNWMDPCYERFYEVGATFIAYWVVNGEVRFLTQE
uniref:Uncharacterized protein n=1 Tax=Caenorhabditis japonica TaxID=281687 RepID=A0A8R1ESB2_CAEJA